MMTAKKVTILDTEETLREIYKTALEDRERALNYYTAMKDKIEKVLTETKEVPRPGVLSALNEAQKLIQTSTDKLINLANLLAKRDTNKNLEEMNFHDLPKDLLVEDQETQEDRILKINKAS